MKKLISVGLALVMTTLMLSFSAGAMTTDELLSMEDIFLDESYIYTDEFLNENIFFCENPEYRDDMRGFCSVQGVSIIEIHSAKFNEAELSDTAITEALAGIIDPANRYLSIDFYYNSLFKETTLHIYLTNTGGAAFSNIDSYYFCTKLYLGLIKAYRELGMDDVYFVATKQIMGPLTGPGDANFDCDINLIDALYLRRYLSGNTIRIFTCADANSDGIINALDILTLRRLVTSA